MPNTNDLPSQGSVMMDYAAILKWDEISIGSLHRFFSPHQVPTGLTDDEVHICVELFQLKNAILDLRVAEAIKQGQQKMICEIEKPLPFPKEFIRTEPMTREHFKAGLYQYMSFLNPLPKTSNKNG